MFSGEPFIIILLANWVEPNQIRCTDPALCTKSGVKVVVTDFTDDNRTDFLLYFHTFASLARPGKIDQLLNMGAGLGVEHKRWAPIQESKKKFLVKLVRGTFVYSLNLYLFFYSLNLCSIPDSDMVDMCLIVYDLNMITASHAIIQVKICPSK